MKPKVHQPFKKKSAISVLYNYIPCPLYRKEDTDYYSKTDYLNLISKDSWPAEIMLDNTKRCILQAGRKIN